MALRSDSGNRLQNRLKKCAPAFAFLLIIVAVLTLLGWQFNLEFFKRPLPHLVAMNPMTAVAFIFSAMAIWLLSVNYHTKNIRAAQLLSIVIGLIGGIKLLYFIPGCDLQIDYWLFANKVNQEAGNIISNRMAPNTALNFVLLSIALFLSGSSVSKNKALANNISLLILALGLFSVIGYVFRAQEFYNWLHNLPMAIHTACCFIIVSTSILFLNSNAGVMATFTSSNYGGILSRRLVPAVIVVPFFLGYLRLLVYWYKPFSVELGVSALITLIIIVFFLVVWYLSRALNKSDLGRATAQEELKRLNENLYKLIAERTKTLEATEKKLGHAIDNMLEGAQMHDPQWRYLYVNDALVKYSGGFSREQLLGHTLMEIYPGIEQSPLFKTLERCMAERATERMETEFVYPNGAKAYFDLSIQPIPEGIFILSMNITERKKSEEQQILFTSIVNSSDDAILSKNLDGIITSWNHGAEKVFGYTADEMLGKHISVLIPAHLRDEEKEIIKKIRNGEVVDHYETERIRKDGTIIVVSLTISPIKDLQGKIIGASKVSRDITESKRAQDKIVKTSRLYAFLSAINQSIVHITDEKALMDRACNIAVEIGQFKMAWLSRIDANRKVNVVGFCGDKVAAQRILKQTGWDCDDPGMKNTPIGRVLNTGKYAFNNDVQNDPMLLGWKEEFVREGIYASISLPIFSFGKVTGFLGLHAGERGFFDEQEIALLVEATGDISFALENFEKEKLRKQAEDEVGRLNAELEMRVEQRTAALLEAYQQMESFSYTASHDLRSPLQVIGGYAGLLSKKYAEQLNEDAQRMLGNIKDYVKKMAQLIDDLLNFSQMGKVELVRKPVDMNELMQVVIKEMASADSDLKAEIKLLPLKPAQGDIALLHQVCINLVANALKYSNKVEAPLVQIGCMQLEGENVYYVKDNGAGFDMQFAHKLFQAFQRLHKLSEFEGTGVGLALVHAIITKHGGRIWAEGKVNEGATFYFTLPVVETVAETGKELSEKV